MEILKVYYKIDYIDAKIIGFALGIVDRVKLGIIGSIYLVSFFYHLKYI